MRHINPWLLWPVSVATIVGGVIGWIVTAISCQPDTCPASSAAVAVIASVVSGLGVGVVAVLAIRSLAEWRAAESAGLPLPEPGCEGPPEEAPGSGADEFQLDGPNRSAAPPGGRGLDPDPESEQRQGRPTDQAGP
jgi:hypothetical protein